MKSLTQGQFNNCIKQAKIRPKLAQELRFVASTSHLSAADWHNNELVAIADRNGNKGVLLIAPDDDLYIVPYELSSGIVSKTGQAQPIICDFCRTWQSGTRAGSITLPNGAHVHDKIGFLCCADLLCSRHVRSQTDASKTSRAHLREDLTDEQRAERLRQRLRQLVTRIGLSPVTSVSV